MSMSDVYGSQIGRGGAGQASAGKGATRLSRADRALATAPDFMQILQQYWASQQSNPANVLLPEPGSQRQPARVLPRTGGQSILPESPGVTWAMIRRFQDQQRRQAAFLGQLVNAGTQAASGLMSSKENFNE